MRLFVIIIGVFVLAASIIFALPNLLPSPPFFSPLSQNNDKALTGATHTLKRYGFLPHWRLSEDVSVLIPDTITDVIYFSLSLDASGAIVTGDPGYTKLISAYQKVLPLHRFHLAVTTQSHQALVSMLSSSSAQIRAIDSITQMAESYPLAGINLDFEPTQTTPQLAHVFNTFITGLIQAVAMISPPPVITVDVYANAASVNNLWDISYLANQPINLVIMGYDYHRQSSSLAGAVGPIHNLNGESLSADVAAFTRKVKPSNLILGIPLYGYQWHITDPSTKHTYPKTAKAVYLNDIPSLLSRFNAQTFWDPNSLSPYAIFNSQDKQYYVAYESIQSLNYKKDIASQLQFDGVAYWALGYLSAQHPYWSH